MKGTLSFFGTIVGTVFVLLVIAIILVGALAGDLVNVIKEIQLDKPTAVMVVTPYNKLPVQVREKFSRAIGFQYISLIDNKDLPRDGSQGLFTEFADQQIKDCGDPVAVAPFGEVWRPTDVSAQNGQKTFWKLGGVVPVGKLGCEDGRPYRDPDYNPDYAPGTAAWENIWTTSKCTVRMVFMNTKEQIFQCSQQQYRPFGNFARQGLNTNGTQNATVQIVYATASGGIWVEGLTRDNVTKIFGTPRQIDANFASLLLQMVTGK